jgi:hypothetical protein
VEKSGGGIQMPYPFPLCIFLECPTIKLIFNQALLRTPGYVLSIFTELLPPSSLQTRFQTLIFTYIVKGKAITSNNKKSPR